MTKSQFKFHRALRKYGWDDFEWEIICQSKDGEYLYNTIEDHFINYYNSITNGYNLTGGGGGALNPSPETRKKMRDAKIGYVPWNKGKKCPSPSQKTKDKMSASRLGKKQNLSDEQRKAASQRNVERFSGKPLSEAHKAKMRLAQQARRIRETSIAYP